MKRKEFLNSACKIGLCSCIGMPLAASEIFAKNDDEKKVEDWRIGFMQRRFSKLLDIVKSNVSEEDKEKIIEGLGRECAKEGKEWSAKYVGNVEGILEDMKAKWIEAAEYDKEKGIIKLYGKKTGKCGCPLVNNSQIAKEFCNCSLGYQKEQWGMITGKKIEASIIESVLYGSDRCSFIVKLV